MNITIGSVVEIILVLIIGLWMAARSKPKYSVYNRSKYFLTPKAHLFIAAWKNSL
ncbi:hypothetical protein [Chryseobacterium sp.]|uniref:hypothetical protein n=1 Tax=Chryseobacterium sp. TaxID=1871047 RepID=UPI00262BA65F|nr:hypothetical protein [Chryseobacterium sp.]